MERCERESEFELLRLIAMFCIVLLHIYLLELRWDRLAPLNTAIVIPFHMGVPLFVLISGYFGIRVSGRGLAHLVGQMLVYTIFLLLIYKCEISTGGGIRGFFFISNSPYWFMKTYLFLYLFSPVVNHYLEDITVHRRLYLLLSLVFMSVYMQTMLRGEYDWYKGRDVLTFILLYVLGNTLHAYKHVWMSISMRYLIPIFLLLNVCIVAIGCHVDLLSSTLFLSSIQNSGAITIVNASLLFIIVAKRPFKSKIVNWLAASSLAVYLIHISDFAFHYIRITVRSVSSLISNDCIALFVMCLFASAVMLACTMVDKLLAPLWRFFRHLGSKVENAIVAFLDKEYSKEKK